MPKFNFSSLEEKPHPPIIPPKPMPILHPPQEVIKTPITKIIQNQEGEIDFEKIAKSSEFKRLVYLIYTGKTHRGTKQDLGVKLRTHKENISIVEVIKHDSALIREITSNPLYLKQQSKHNS